MVGKDVEADNFFRANSYDEIRPLVALCKAGKLYEVQAWIDAGRPVNRPLGATGAQHSPLFVAVKLGFHSLVEVLLKGNAIQEPEAWKSPMSLALEMKRMDLVELLVEHGFDAATVDMQAVFDTWDPKIMEYFIDRGADIRDGNPFAYAFGRRVQTALRVFKKYRNQFPDLDEQANIALRYHCKNGNMKWVSLMLWLGADPYSSGSCACNKYDDNHDFSAVVCAAIYRHYEVFDVKQLHLERRNPELKRLLTLLDEGEGIAILHRLLQLGLDPNDEEKHGCSAIHSILSSMSWDFGRDRRDALLDTRRAKEAIRAIHLIARYGGKWVPTERHEFDSARRSLAKLIPDYALEFVWIMTKYRACSFEAINEMLRTPTMKRHLRDKRHRLEEILESWQKSSPEGENVAPKADGHTAVSRQTQPQ